VSEGQRLRDKAAHAREMAWALTDRHARAALEALAGELEQQASVLEREERDRDKQNDLTSRSDTP
jgi:hypothetical protein